MDVTRTRRHCDHLPGTLSNADETLHWPETISSKKFNVVLCSVQSGELGNLGCIEVSKLRRPRHQWEAEGREAVLAARNSTLGSKSKECHTVPSFFLPVQQAQ